MCRKYYMVTKYLGGSEIMEVEITESEYLMLAMCSEGYFRIGQKVGTVEMWKYYTGEVHIWGDWNIEKCPLETSLKEKAEKFGFMWVG